MDETWILIDEDTGLHVGWYFWLRVLDEVNRSTRYGAPFALLLLEACALPGSPPRLVQETAGRVPGAIRSTDLGGLVGVGRVGVLLPHQDVAQARCAEQRIIERLGKSTPREIRWERRLLCYPGDGAKISNLLTSGWREHRSSEAAPGIERLA